MMSRSFIAPLELHSQEQSPSSFQKQQVWIYWEQLVFRVVQEGVTPEKAGVCAGHWDCVSRITYTHLISAPLGEESLHY